LHLIFGFNFDFQKELSDLRQELCETRALNNIKKHQSLEQNNQNDSKTNGHNSSLNERNSFDILRTKDISEINELTRQKLKQLELRNEECNQLRYQSLNLM